MKTIPAVAETGCAAVAALCLRTPTNAEAFVDSGVASILREILKIHRLRAAIEVCLYMCLPNILPISFPLLIPHLYSKYYLT